MEKIKDKIIFLCLNVTHKHRLCAGNDGQTEAKVARRPSKLVIIPHHLWLGVGAKGRTVVLTHIKLI